MKTKNIIFLLIGFFVIFAVILLMKTKYTILLIGIWFTIFAIILLPYRTYFFRHPLRTLKNEKIDYDEVKRIRKKGIIFFIIIWTFGILFEIIRRYLL